MAILEGMASGLSLVATTVGDVPTVVLDGRTGITVPSENVELLAAGIVKLLQDSEIRARYGEAARKLIEEKFSAERMADDYLRVYAGVVRGRFWGMTTSEPRVASKENEAEDIKK